MNPRNDCFTGDTCAYPCETTGRCMMDPPRSKVMDIVLIATTLLITAKTILDYLAA